MATYTAIKPVFNRQTKAYTVEKVQGDQLIIGLAQQGYYVTDNLYALFTHITLRQCGWFAKLHPAKQDVVRAWLTETLTREGGL